MFIVCVLCDPLAHRYVVPSWPRALRWMRSRHANRIIRKERESGGDPATGSFTARCPANTRPAAIFARLQSHEWSTPGLSSIVEPKLGAESRLLIAERCVSNCCNCKRQQSEDEVRREEFLFLFILGEKQRRCRNFSLFLLLDSSVLSASCWF